MKTIASLSLLVIANGAFGHGDHSEQLGMKPGETVQQYAQRHMSSEHHIDTFDTRSFFLLHDLNRNGRWERDEIEAVYGVHHIYSTKKSKDEAAHQEKAKTIVDTVLRGLDKDGDGFITAEELEAVGLDGLPNFDDLGAEGHHYDVESEFFLHHEEQFHSTPETQTEESYNHPEDLEHFAQHQAIEHEEAEKEAKFQGITVDEVLQAQQQAQVEAQQPEQAESHESPEDSSKPQEIPGVPVAEHPHGEQVQKISPVQDPPPKVTRVAPPEKQDPSIRFKDASGDAKARDGWGTGDGGFMVPRDASERLRRNLPYKYKFRRNWGDF